MMSLSKKQLISLCVVVSFGICIVMVECLLQAPCSNSPISFEKTGRISSKEYLLFPWGHSTQTGAYIHEDWTPPLTCIAFEDGEMLILMGIIKDIKVNKTYCIVYSGHGEYFRYEQWSEKYYLAESIEEIHP